MTTHKITPHLWFDTQAKAAAEFYVSLFPNSAVEHLTVLRDTPSGDSDMVTFTLAGQPFMAISAGPFFTPNPSVSFIVNCATAAEVDVLWAQLSDGGTALMPLDAYPFNPHFGWVQDRFGISWQVSVAEGQGGGQPIIVPCLLFTGENFGKAAEAIRFYTSVFKDTQLSQITYNPDAPGADGAPTVLFANFLLEGQRFTIIESGEAHGFTFSEAISFIVGCETQTEIDHYWAKLSAVAEAEQCGWLKDKYGVSWQISPTALDVMIREGTPVQAQRVMQTFMPMKKLDIAALERAYRDAA
jgi:predicted 3-demethylubiquinone-9 3-methyltransferase (glyoxalase superfamily)